MTGKRKALMAGAALVLCAAAAAVNTPAAYVPSVFFLLLCLSSMLYTALCAWALQIQAEAEDWGRCERGTASHCRVTVFNRGVLPLPCAALTLCVESEQGFAPLLSEHLLMLRPRQRLELDLPLAFPHIGRYRVRVRRVRVYGLLGLGSFSRRPKWSAEVRVVPRRFRLSALRLRTSRPLFAVDFTAPHKTGGGEYSDVRQYAPGDPLKTIHWKLSAHASGYVTRLFQTDAVSGASIYLDFRLPPGLAPEGAADVNDCLAESAYAAAARAMELQYGVELIYARSGVPAVVRPESPEELMAAVYALPPVSAGERYPLELLVEERSGQAASFDNLIVLTARVSGRLIARLTDCAQRGKYPLLIQIVGKDGPPEDGGPSAERLAGRGIEYRAVSCACELSRVLEERL